MFPQGLVNVALDILSRIHTIPTVPIVDCFQKIRQQVKCYLQLAGVMGKNECMQVRCPALCSAFQIRSSVYLFSLLSIKYRCLCRYLTLVLVCDVLLNINNWHNELEY